jgi:hypothetical protein
MRCINLISKPKKKDSIRRTIIQISAIRKWIRFHDKNIIKYQQQEIDCLKTILNLHGISI